MRCLFGNGSGSRKRDWGRCFFWRDFWRESPACAFSGAVCAKSGLSGYGYAVGNFRMEHEPDGIVFILPAKKAWNGAAARAACTFRGRDDLSDCVCSGERTGGRDDPDGAVAALWNPGELLFLAALVPQQAVLVPGYCMLLEWCLHKKLRRACGFPWR